jgi:hypothetical protein
VSRDEKRQINNGRKVLHIEYALNMEYRYIGKNDKNSNEQQIHIFGLNEAEVSTHYSG